jgi:hypothetical protein
VRAQYATKLSIRPVPGALFYKTNREGAGKKSAQRKSAGTDAAPALFYIDRR